MILSLKEQSQNLLEEGTDDDEDTAMSGIKDDPNRPKSEEKEGERKEEIIKQVQEKRQKINEHKAELEAKLTEVKAKRAEVRSKTEALLSEKTVQLQDTDNMEKELEQVQEQLETEEEKHEELVQEVEEVQEQPNNIEDTIQKLDEELVNIQQNLKTAEEDNINKTDVINELKEIQEGLINDPDNAKLESKEARINVLAAAILDSYQEREIEKGLQDPHELEGLDELEKVKLLARKMKYYVKKLKKLKNSDENILRLENEYSEKNTEYANKLKRHKKIAKIFKIKDLDPQNISRSFSLRDTKMVEDPNFQKAVLIGRKNDLKQEIEEYKQKLLELKSKMEHQNLPCLILPKEVMEMMEVLERGFFSNNKKPALFDPFSGSCKVDLSPTGKYFFLGGKSGVIVGKKEVYNNLKKVKKLDCKDVKELKACPNNCLIVHYGKENNLKVFNKSLKELKFIEGQEMTADLESKLSMGNMKYSSSYTGSVKYFLWSSGKATLSLVDVTTYEVIEINDFWEHRENKLAIKPILVVATNNGSRIFGLGIDSKGNLTLVYYQPVFEGEGGTVLNKKKSIVSQKGLGDYAGFDSILCAEVSFNQHIVVVGGFKGSWACLGAISFDKKLEQVHAEDFKVDDFSQITSLKRIAGTDAFIAGGLKRVMVYVLKNQRKFQMLFSCKGVSEQEVHCLLFHTKFIYSLTAGSGQMSQIEFVNEMNYKEAIERENTLGIKQSEEA